MPIKDGDEFRMEAKRLFPEALFIPLSEEEIEEERQEREGQL